MRTIEDYTKLFQSFCSEFRPHMMSPAIQNGHAFAADGHTLLMLENSDLPFEERSKPNFNGVVPSERLYEQIIMIQSLKDALENHVPKTNELSYTKCITCDGDGYQECDLGHDHECEDCHGDGQIGSLTGKTILNPDYRCEMYDIVYRCSFLMRLISVAEFEQVSIITRVYGDAFNKGSLFLVGNFKVLIMPITKNDIGYGVPDFTKIL